MKDKFYDREGKVLKIEKVIKNLKPDDTLLCVKGTKYINEPKTGETSKVHIFILEKGKIKVLLDNCDGWWPLSRFVKVVNR